MSQTRKSVRQTQMIEWRRQKILELAANGYSNREISSTLKIPHATVDRDILVLRSQAKEQINEYITHQVPFEYKKTLAGLGDILRNMSNIISKSSDSREIMQASSIKMQAYNMKMELVSNANLVHEAIDLVERYRGYASQKVEVVTNGSAEST